MKERERERKRAQWCEVWWVLVRGAECGRTALPGQIFCPRDLWLSAFSGGRSLRMERVPEEENVWFQLNLHGEDCGFITLEWNQTRSRLLFEISGGRPSAGPRIHLESQLNILKPSYLMQSALLLDEVQFIHSSKKKKKRRTKQLITHGWERQCNNAWAISNKTASWNFSNFSLGSRSRTGFNRETVANGHADACFIRPGWEGMNTVVFHFIKLQMKWFTWEAWTCI